MASSSISFSSITNSIKDKWSHLVDNVVNGFKNNFKDIKAISYIATLILGGTIFIGIPFAFLLKYSPIVIAHPLYILAGLIMLNPLFAKIVITGFIISSIAWISLTMYEH